MENPSGREKQEQRKKKVIKTRKGGQKQLSNIHMLPIVKSRKCIQCFTNTGKTDNIGGPRSVYIAVNICIASHFDNQRKQFPL